MTDQMEDGCLFGNVRYRIEGKPIVCLACHCTFCQLLTSSAYSSVTCFNEAQVAITGDLKECAHRSDETGRATALKFCLRCGVTVAHVAEAKPGWVGAEIGTLHDKCDARLERHVWIRSKQPWTAISDDVDLYDRGSADRAKPIRRAVRTLVGASSRPSRSNTAPHSDARDMLPSAKSSGARAGGRGR